MSDKNNSGLEVVAAELLSKLSVASAVIGNLPELPGFNGSVLTIDDTEAAQIVKDLDEVRDGLVRLSDAEAALASAKKEIAGWVKISEAEDEFNTSLVAVNAELVEALRGALKALDAIGDEMTVGERYTNAGQYLIDALEPARAALLKAEGTKP